MAAITPHLERQDDPAETAAEDTYFSRVRLDSSKGLSGLGKAEGDVLIRGSLSSEVLNDSHAGLERVAYTRIPLLESLRDVPYEVLLRTKQGRPDLYIRTEAPSGLDPRWNAPGTGSLQNTSLLSWTSKMGAPSFSLPAGSPIMAGTCPGADAGQSIVPDDKLVSASRLVTKITGRPVVLPDAICQHCYAEGGNYAYGNIQWHQLIRAIWTRQAVKDGSFVDLMTYAVDTTDFLLDGGNFPGKGAAGAYEPERHEGRFFRIHDSGDFYDRHYLRAWRQVAANLPDVTFWAPSRIWATSWGVAAVNELNAGDTNLTIRPSIYHVNEPRPRHADLGPGWSAWTVVYSPTQKPGGGPRFDGEAAPYNWDCQAYAVDDEAASCRNAIAPDGAVGCRACWVHPELAVNYTFH